MKQTLNFFCRMEDTKAVNIDIEPGDGTRYSFVVTHTEGRHDWGDNEGPIIGVASVSGCMFGGQWMPLRKVMEWWAETKDETPDESLSHHFIGWIMGEMRPGTTTNPWTVRAALLAVLKTNANMGVPLADMDEEEECVLDDGEQEEAEALSIKAERKSKEAAG